jgi:hypothetical protein
VTDASTEPAAPEVPAEPTGEGTEAQRLDKVEDAVEQILGILKGGGGGQGTETDPEESKSQAARETRQAVRDILAAEERKKSRDREAAAREARLAAVEDKVKEKPPREYRRVTKWLGWTGDEG